QGMADLEAIDHPAFRVVGTVLARQEVAGGQLTTPEVVGIVLTVLALQERVGTLAVQRERAVDPEELQPGPDVAFGIRDRSRVDAAPAGVVEERPLAVPDLVVEGVVVEVAIPDRAAQVDHVAAVLRPVQKRVVAPTGEGVALIGLLIARVLPEQAGIEAPVRAAHPAADTELAREPERVDDRGALHEREEQAVGGPLERVEDLVLAYTHMRGLHELAAVLDVGVFQVEIVVGEVSFYLV